MTQKTVINKEYFEKAKQHLITKEKLQKAEEEAKLLGTAMQQLLPEIFEDRRAIPNCFLRGALFGMVRKGRRSLVENQPIFTMSQYKVSFSGSEMDQNDLELWDTLMYLAKNRQVDTELRITLYDLCQQMRLTDAKSNYERLTTRAKRLAFGKVSIKADNKEYFGSLLDDVYIDNDGDGKLVIRYNKKLAPLFTDGDYTLISADIRHLLGDNQLARWLYNFYETHNQPLPFTIDFLQKLCRSDNSPKDFKYKLKIALAQVKKAHLAVDIKSKWECEITKNNYLLVYPNGKTKKQLELFSRF
ncbi:MAG TPA: plasmid replication initiator TrfA [Burkholderiales bacterium]|nr:plasmid replication initiator TrfA [Burkholderiales bacterium]